MNREDLELERIDNQNKLDKIHDTFTNESSMKKAILEKFQKDITEKNIANIPDGFKIEVSFNIDELTEIDSVVFKIREEQSNMITNKYFPLMSGFTKINFSKSSFVNCDLNTSNDVCHGFANGGRNITEIIPDAKKNDLTNEITSAYLDIIQYSRNNPDLILKRLNDYKEKETIILKLKKDNDIEKEVRYDIARNFQKLTIEQAFKKAGKKTIQRLENELNKSDKNEIKFITFKFPKSSREHDMSVVNITMVKDGDQFFGKMLEKGSYHKIKEEDLKLFISEAIVLDGKLIEDLDDFKLRVLGHKNSYSDDSINVQFPIYELVNKAKDVALHKIIKQVNSKNKNFNLKNK